MKIKEDSPLLESLHPKTQTIILLPTLDVTNGYHLTIRGQIIIKANQLLYDIKCTFVQKCNIIFISHIYLLRVFSESFRLYSLF